MPFKKQDTRINKNGRPKGSANKSTDQLRNVFQAFLETNLETMQRDFDLLKPIDRLNFIERIAKMIIPAPPTALQITEEPPKITGITFDGSD